MPRAALLVTNPTKPGVARATPEVRRILQAHATLIGEIQGDSTSPPPVTRETVIVVLGGDGTLLTQARRFAHSGAALLGVNFGKVGFLAEFDLPTLERQGATLFSGGPLPVRERMLIHAALRKAGANGREESLGLAINECVITAGPPYRMIGIDIALDGEPGPSVTGDGVIVATPLGSTAYNVSAGGPIVSPEIEAFVITPLAPHSLSFRPFIAPPSCAIDMTVTRSNRPAAPGPGLGTTLVLDGQAMIPLGVGDTVRLRRHAVPARLVVNKETTYWRTLMGKMHWASAPGDPGRPSSRT